MNKAIDFIPSTSAVHLPRPAQVVRYLRSRLRSPDIQVAVVDRILDRYGLESRGLPRNLAVGRRSRNLILETSAGWKVLKRYRRIWPESTIVYSHSILLRLAQLDFPAVRLVSTPEAESFVRLGDEFYALFDYAAGKNYATSFVPSRQYRKLAAQAGEALAKLHCTLNRFVPEGGHHLGYASYEGDRRRDKRWHIERLDRLKTQSRALPDGGDRVQAEWLARQSVRLSEEFCEAHEALAEAPLARRVIHGDYGLHNLLYARHPALTLTDFELARIEWRLSDFVLLLPRFRREGLRPFVAAYQAISPFSPEERELFPQVWRFRKLAGTIQSWNNYFALDRAGHRLLSARRSFLQAKWAIDHKNMLQQLMS